jgi:hypothetical protein
VVFPEPAGAIASCSRAPEVHICRTRNACPGSSAVPLAAHLQQGKINSGAVDDRSVADAGGGDEAMLGIQDPPRGVEVGAGEGVNRRPVDPPQRIWFFDAVRWRGQGYGPVLKDLINEEIHQRVRVLGRHVDGPDLALGFGIDVPHLPGRPGLLHGGQHPVGGLRDPAGVDDRGGLGRRRKGRPHH